METIKINIQLQYFEKEKNNNTFKFKVILV